MPFDQFSFFTQIVIFRIVKEELLMGRSLDFTVLSGGLDIESALISPDITPRFQHIAVFVPLFCFRDEILSDKNI